jgi:hypothetical protein
VHNLVRRTIPVTSGLIAGVLFASIGTNIWLPCPPAPGDPTSHCISYQKVHLGDITHNIQGSLTRFLINVLIGFAMFVALLISVRFVIGRFTLKRSRRRR